MRSLTFAAVLAATLLAPTAATATEPSTEDWRAAACTDPITTDVPGPPEYVTPSGAATPVTSSRVAVDGLPGVRVGVDRLDFAGASCEVFYVDGALPRGAEIAVTRNTWCAAFDRAVDGEDEGRSESCSSFGESTPLYTGGMHDAPKDVLVLSAWSFRHESTKVLQAGHGTPPQDVGATWTSVHAGSSWRVRLVGTTEVRREFERSGATDRAARTAYARQVRRAQRVFEARMARIRRSAAPLELKAWQTQEARDSRRSALALAGKKQRLALEGIRLVVRDFRSSDSGTLPAG